jgi:hypothetical protein
MPETEKLVKRSDKVAFLNVGTSENKNFQRMRKFTEISTSKNSTEYGRRYVDEDTYTVDTTGYAEEKSYAFDQYKNNTVHERIAKITDDELVGDDATVEVLVVDKTKEVEGGFEARLRKYAVIPDSDGDSTDAYTYSGSLKAKGTFEKVTATISEDGKTATVVTE